MKEIKIKIKMLDYLPCLAASLELNLIKEDEDGNYRPI